MVTSSLPEEYGDEERGLLSVISVLSDWARNRMVPCTEDAFWWGGEPRELENGKGGRFLDGLMFWELGSGRGRTTGAASEFKWANGLKGVEHTASLY